MAITQAFKDYLNNTSSYRVAHLVQFELSYSTDEAPAFIYITDASRDIEWDGNTYQKGKVLSLGNSKSAVELTNYTMKLTMPGIDEIELARAITDSETASYVGKVVTIYRAYFDDSDNILESDDETGGPLIYFQGPIQSLEVSENPSSSSTITWNLGNDWSLYLKSKGRITKDAYHRALDENNETVVTNLTSPYFEDDYGFEYVGTSADLSTQYQYTDSVAVVKSKTKKNWLGMVTGVKTWTEYKSVTETNTIELELDLGENTLPVVYGTRYVSGGIPVFADILTSPTSTTSSEYLNLLDIAGSQYSYDIRSLIASVAATSTAYIVTINAICEGKIAGYLDVVEDGVFQVCKDSDAEDDSDSGDGSYCIGNFEEDNTIFGVSELGLNKSTLYKTVDGTLTAHIFYTGALDQAADPLMVGLNDAGMLGNYSWTENHRLSGTAYIISIFELDNNRSEVPEIGAVVTGIDHTNTANPNYVEGFKDYGYHNPVIHLYDYLTNDIYGAKIDADRFSLEQFEAAAAYADVEDTSYDFSFIESYKTYLGYLPDATVSPWMQQARSLDGSSTLFDLIKDLTYSWGLSLVRSSGRYSLLVKGIPYDTVADLGVGDIIGSIAFKDDTEKSKKNSVTASIVDPANDWSSTSVPMYNSDYFLQDNSVTRSDTYSFGHISNYYTARNWANMRLDESRSSKSITIEVPQRFTYITPGNLVTFTYARFGWDLKLFRVYSVDRSSTGSIKLVLNEYVQSTYTNTLSQSQAVTTPSSTLVTTTTAVTNITWADAEAGLNNVNGVLSWSPSVAASHYIVTWEDGTYTQIANPRSKTTKVNYTVYNKPTGTYTVSIAAVSVKGESRPKSFTFTMQAAPLALSDDLSLTVSDTESASWVFSWDADTLDDGTLATDYLFEIYEYTVGDQYSILIRQETISGFTFTYSSTDNIADHLASKGTPGVFRQISARVRASHSSVWSYL
jgi:hypothetical protein